MASDAVNHSPGRLAGIFRWLVPNRRCLAMAIAVEIGLTLVGLPAWVHLVVVALLHLTLARRA